MILPTSATILEEPLTREEFKERLRPEIIDEVIRNSDFEISQLLQIREAIALKDTAELGALLWPSLNAYIVDIYEINKYQQIDQLLEG